PAVPRHALSPYTTLFRSLPGRAYTIGFVRAYAQYLGLHAGECVERLKAEIAGRNEIREPAVTTTVAGERRLTPGGVVLALLLVIDRKSTRLNSSHSQISY